MKINLQNFLLLSRRHLRPRLQLHCHQQQQHHGVPRLPLQEEENSKFQKQYDQLETFKLIYSVRALRSE